jgi:hypothetical protein
LAAAVLGSVAASWLHSRAQNMQGAYGGESLAAHWLWNGGKYATFAGVVGGLWAKKPHVRAAWAGVACYGAANWIRLARG